MDIQQLQNQITELQNQITQRQTDIQNLNNTVTNLTNEKTWLSQQMNSLQNQINEHNNQKQAEINNLNVNFQNERSGLQNQVSTLTWEKQQLDIKVNSLGTEIQRLTTNIESIKANFDSERSILEQKLLIKDKEIEELKKQINGTVLEDMSKSYQEYSQDQWFLVLERNKWASIVNIAFITVAVLTCIILGMFYLWDTDLSKKVATFSIDLIAASWLWFTINQYSYYKKLVIDYKNRKVVAESFLGVLNNLNDENTRNEATKIVVETLFSRSVVDSWNELPLKEVVSVVDKFINKQK